MQNTTYNIRIDKQVRDQADALYKSMGLSLSSAINLFLRQSVIQGKLPISEVIAEPAYADMLLRDADKIDAAIAKGTAKLYKTPDELFAAWEKQNEQL
ncbi:MAG: type II toxin-antitoxin system RelB/DinJ family antitoxin [Firmicutes bacterium]|nr:type II toxin-antitoxin system RelB/DinJ family antitoxin [Bacillota bacterium]